MLHFIFDGWIGNLFRLIGVCVLFVSGKLKHLVNPSATAYSFMAIYRMDYDKGDGYKQMMERAGQQITGVLFFGGSGCYMCNI